MLTTQGEAMTTAEIEEYLNLLIGDANYFKKPEANEITADEFAENILGFEEVEEMEGEGDEYE